MRRLFGTVLRLLGYTGALALCVERPAQAQVEAEAPIHVAVLDSLMALARREAPVVLAAHGITTRDALADLAGDELVELTGMEPAKAQDLIMKARAHWFEPVAESPQTGAAA